MLKNHCKEIGAHTPNLGIYWIEPEGLCCRCLFCKKTMFKPREEDEWKVYSFDVKKEE